MKQSFPEFPSVAAIFRGSFGLGLGLLSWDFLRLGPRHDFVDVVRRAD